MPSEPSDFEKRIRAVQGYVELGMFSDAREEMAVLGPKDRERIEALACRADIHCGLEEWIWLEEVGRQLVNEMPEKAQWWVTWAHGARYAHTVEAARRILLTAVERLPGVAVLQYNLACYENLLGETENARARLRHAFKLDSSLRALARQDDDLSSLRSWL